MSQKDTEKNKRKKKKGTGLIVVCVTLLILLFAVLIILIWQISRVGNGETVGFWWKNRQYAGSITKYAFCDAGSCADKFIRKRGKY